MNSMAPVRDVLSYKNREFGQLRKTQTNDPPSAVLKPERGNPTRPSTTVSLSSTAQAIATVLRRPASSSSTAVADFDAFLQTLESQLNAQGTKAPSLNELPDTYDPARVALAKQAANHLISTYYGADVAFAQISSDNPLADLDRLSLSKMAFNDSGAFTPAERLLATLEMTARDIDYGNRTYDQVESLRNKNNAVARSIITANSSDLQLATGMTEEEKNWRGWNSLEYFTAYTGDLIQKFSAEPGELAAYRNLKPDLSSELVAYTGTDGAISWMTLPVQKASNEAMQLALIKNLPDNEHPLHDSDKPSGHAWISLYVAIGSYQ